MRTTIFVALLAAAALLAAGPAPALGAFDSPIETPGEGTFEPPAGAPARAPAADARPAAQPATEASATPPTVLPTTGGSVSAGIALLVVGALAFAAAVLLRER